MTPTWIIMPVLADPVMTLTAISDCLAQTVPTRVLVVNQGVDDDFRHRLEQVAEEYPDRVFLWSHQPPLPSLSATWNRALDFVWEQSDPNGNPEEWAALVVNNDVRLHRETIRVLQLYLRDEHALFVSAVGVTEAQFDPMSPSGVPDAPDGGRLTARGGPDFSCFLISWQCHCRYRFDEAFIPAFCEDLDYHRRLMLAGDGQRIFSVNLPYLHYASQTLKTLGPDHADRIRRQIESVSRAHYAKKWGGPVNAERYLKPRVAADTDRLGAGDLDLLYEARNDSTATTPYLFDRERRRWETGDRRDLQELIEGGSMGGVRECGQMVPTGTGSTVCRRELGHNGPCSSKPTVLRDPEPERETQQDFYPGTRYGSRYEGVELPDRPKPPVNLPSRLPAGIEQPEDLDE